MILTIHILEIWTEDEIGEYMYISEEQGPAMLSTLSSYLTVKKKKL